MQSDRPHEVFKVSTRRFYGTYLHTVSAGQFSEGQCEPSESKQELDFAAPASALEVLNDESYCKQFAVWECSLLCRQGCFQRAQRLKALVHSPAVIIELSHDERVERRAGRVLHDAPHDQRG